MKGGDYHLVRYEAPSRTNVKSSVDLCILSSRHLAGGENALTPDLSHSNFRLCPIELRPHESIIILSVSVLYTHSDLDEVVELEVYGLWGQDVPLPPTGSVSHPDFTGTFTICIPPRTWNGIPSSVDTQLLYQPRWATLGFNALVYAGYEHQILEARSTCISYHGILSEASEYQTFMRSDPFMWFLMENKQHFPQLESEDIVKMTECEGYMVKRKLVARVQDFFRTTLFPLYRYRRDGAGLQFRISQSGPRRIPEGAHVALMVQMDYVVVSTNIGPAPVRVFDVLKKKKT